MTRTGRLVLIAVLGGAGVVFAPASASAQFYGGYGGPGVGPYGGFNQLYSYNYIPLNIRVGTPLGPNVTWRQGAYGPVGYWMGNQNILPGYYRGYGVYNPYAMNPGPGPNYSGNYMSGGVRNSGGYNPVAALAQQNIAVAQNQGYNSGTQYGARDAIAKQWEIEKGGQVAGPNKNPNPMPNPNPGGALQIPPDLLDALAVADESKLLSGEYLNRLRDEILVVEGRGGRGQPTVLGPTLLGQVRFGGSPAGDSLNVLRQAGRLEFPAAFDTVDGLKALRVPLEQGLVAIASPLRLGRPADATKVARFEEDLKKANAALAPAINTMPFEDATAARRFLNRLDAAAKVGKDPRSAGVVNPVWDTAGVNVSDLAKHMAKYKIQFGPADPADAEAYATVHQSLAGYLFQLHQSEPRKK